jgi:hypothetical protein
MTEVLGWGAVTGVLVAIGFWLWFRRLPGEQTSGTGLVATRWQRRIARFVLAAAALSALTLAQLLFSAGAPASHSDDDDIVFASMEVPARLL